MKWMLLALLLMCAPQVFACDHSHKQYLKFRSVMPCPATGKTTGACPGYVVDHVIALCKEGQDIPSNMQWQTKSDAKAKDKVECK